MCIRDRADVLAMLFVGGMIPVVFSALAMQSVGKAAMEMVEEVRRQFREIPGILEGKGKPEYAKCVDISTKAALKEMILPGLLTIITPILIGLFFGAEPLGGYMAGVCVSGVMWAIFQNNSEIGCAGNTFQDNDTIVYYNWDFGDCNTTTISIDDPSNSSNPFPNIGWSYPLPGIYIVTLEAYAYCLPPSDTSAIITVYPKPNVSFTHNESICDGDSVFFSTDGLVFADSAYTRIDTCSIFPDTIHVNVPAGDSNFTYLWDFDDPASGVTNNTSDDPNPSHKFSSCGSYNVSLTVTDGNNCIKVFENANIKPDKLIAAGGGSQSERWLEIISTVTNTPIEIPTNSDHSAALGAARLGILASQDETDINSILLKPEIKKTINPVIKKSDEYQQKLNDWRDLYSSIKETKE